MPHFPTKTFEFTYCIKKKDLAPRALKFALVKSRGFKHACLCVSYALTMDWISVSIVYSHLIYYELRMTHERKPSRSISCFACAECSLRKGAFHSIQESEICVVVRIIKRNYKLKFSGLTVEKVSVPIIEPVSSLKQSIFWNGFFSQSLTYTYEVYE